MSFFRNSYDFRLEPHCPNTARVRCEKRPFRPCVENGARRNCVIATAVPDRLISNISRFNCSRQPECLVEPPLRHISSARRVGSVRATRRRGHIIDTELTRFISLERRGRDGRDSNVIDRMIIACNSIVFGRFDDIARLLVYVKKDETNAGIWRGTIVFLKIIVIGRYDSTIKVYGLTNNTRSSLSRAALGVLVTTSRQLSGCTVDALTL